MNLILIPIASMKAFSFLNAWHLRYSLPLAAILLLVGIYLIRRVRMSEPRAKYLQLTLTVLLGAAAVLAAVNYSASRNTPIGTHRFGTFVNHHEFFHYYMGSKYAKELGYTGLYAASLVADQETGLYYRHKKGEYRELRDGTHRKADDFFADEKEMAAWKARFTPARWAEFSDDVVYFKRAMGRTRWGRALNDKGYNASPIYSAVVGGLLSNRVSTDSETGLLCLSLIDVLLLLGTVGMVVWAFGPRAAFLMVVLVGTHYTIHWWHLKGALLRTDYATLAVMGICFIKKGRMIPAGALLAYSGMVRLFPFILVFGMGAKLVWELVETRRLNPRYVKFFATFGIAIAVFVGGTTAYFGGGSVWGEWKDKIAEHDAKVSPWRMGFKQIYMGAFTTKNKIEATDSVGTKIKKLGASVRLRSKLYKKRKLLFWSVQALVLLISFFAVRRLPDHRAVTFSFVLVFSMVAMTYYYYLLLMVPLLFFAEKLEKPAYAAGIVLLLLSGIAGYRLYLIDAGLESAWKQRFPTYYWLSWMVMVIVIQMLLLAYEETMTAMRADDEEMTNKENDARQRSWRSIAKKLLKKTLARTII